MADARLRLLLVMPTFLPDVFGGAERQALILSRALAAQGVHVTVLAPTVVEQSSDAPSEFGRTVRFRMRHLPNFGGRRIASTVAWASRVAAWARRNAEAFDVVYVFHGRLHALGAVAAAVAAGKPLMLKCGGAGHGFDFDMLKAKRGGYGPLVARLLARRTDGFVANSAAIVEDLLRWGVRREKIFTFPNGVVTPSRADVAAAAEVRTGRRFLFTGRLDHEKSVGVLVEALSICRSKGLACELHFVGDGPAAADLRAQAARLGVGDAVTFRGRRDEVYPELIAADFFVSASTREGQSNSLLEACATGCVPVVAQTSGVPEVVRPGQTGFIVDDPTPAHFAEAMQAALALGAADRAAMSLAAHDLVSEAFGIDAIAGKTIEVANIVLARRGGAAAMPAAEAA